MTAKITFTNPTKDSGAYVDTADCNSCVSDPNRLTISPVLCSSKKPISCLRTLAYTCRRSRATNRSPNTPRIIPRATPAS